MKCARTVSTSSASQERAVAPCAWIICSVVILTVEDFAMELNGVVNFWQNLIWNEYEQEWQKQLDSKLTAFCLKINYNYFPVLSVV